MILRPKEIGWHVMARDNWWAVLNIVMKLQVP
jgi:hypothetical protein